MPAPDGRIQIIRGPRPPAERWPKVARTVSAAQPKPLQSPREQVAPSDRWR